MLRENSPFDLFLAVRRDVVRCGQERPKGLVLNRQRRGQFRHTGGRQNDCHRRRQSHHPQVSSFFFYFQESPLLQADVKRRDSLHVLSFKSFCFHSSPPFFLLRSVIMPFSVWPPATGKHAPTCWPTSKTALTLQSSGWSTGESRPICRLEVSGGAFMPGPTLYFCFIYWELIYWLRCQNDMLTCRLCIIGRAVEVIELFFFLKSRLSTDKHFWKQDNISKSTVNAAGNGASFTNH